MWPLFTSTIVIRVVYMYPITSLGSCTTYPLVKYASIICWHSIHNNTDIIMDTKSLSNGVSENICGLFTTPSIYAWWDMLLWKVINFPQVFFSPFHDKFLNTFFLESKSRQQSEQRCPGCKTSKGHCWKPQCHSWSSVLCQTATMGSTYIVQIIYLVGYDFFSSFIQLFWRQIFKCIFSRIKIQTAKWAEITWLQNLKRTLLKTLISQMIIGIMSNYHWWINIQIIYLWSGMTFFKFFSALWAINF